MRMLFVIITGLTLLFFITVGWYISNTMAVAITSAISSLVSGQAESLVGLVNFVNIVWGPVLDIMIIVWMIASAQARDVESEIYG